ncbi:MAG: Wzz/FepE/Etk N-terminal domain-containing protein [Syntrophomonas sp.]
MTQHEIQQQQYDDEIDLRDIFRTLNKWKYKIISFTLICMLLSGIVSWFFLEPVYEARSVVVLTASTSLTANAASYLYVMEDDPAINSKEISDNVNELVKLAQLDSSNFKQLLNSVTVLGKTINELKLPISINKLKRKIKVEDIKDQKNVAEVAVEGENPEMAASIANMLVKQTTVYLDDINKRKMDRLKKILHEQVAAAEKQLDSSYAHLEEYQAGTIRSATGQKRLESDIKIKENLLNSLSAKIIEVEMLQSIKSAENQIITVSPATVPEQPTKPNKTLNVAIAAVLGLMISVFGVFLIEYLRDEK